MKYIPYHLKAFFLHLNICESSHFCQAQSKLQLSWTELIIFFYFPGVGGSVGGCLGVRVVRWVGEIKNKANLSPAELELGLSLAKV